MTIIRHKKPARFNITKSDGTGLTFEEKKQAINNATYEELQVLWTNTKPLPAWFLGSIGDYFREAMYNKRFHVNKPN